MLPHPETIRKITALHDQDRQRDVAQQRRAASPKSPAHSRPITSWSVRLAGVTWLTGWITCKRGATRVHGTSLLGSGLARPAHHVR
jgi:hypothetical protein